MDMVTAVKTVFHRYFQFNGRSPRAEFWYFVLFSVVVSFATMFLDVAFLGASLDDTFMPLNTLFSLAVLIPSFAVSVRRLHDMGKSGWWVVICIVPLIGLLVLIYFSVQPSQPGTNQYGSNPYGD